MGLLDFCWIGLHAWPPHIGEYEHGEDRTCRACGKYEIWLGWPNSYWAELPRWDA